MFMKSANLRERFDDRVQKHRDPSPRLVSFHLGSSTGCSQPANESGAGKPGGTCASFSLSFPAALLIPEASPSRRACDCMYDAQSASPTAGAAQIKSRR